MALTGGDGLVAAARQFIPITKTASATTTAAQWHTLLGNAGNPGAGSLSIGNTTAGVLVDDAVAGFPLLNAFGSGNTGYLHSVAFANTVACRLEVKDRIWHAGSVVMTTLATTTFTGQPSALGRFPDGAGVGTEIWIEINAAVSATATTVAVGYTNSAGTAGRTTGATATLASYITGRLIQMPLQAGDVGVQKIDSVTIGGTVASAGSVNVILARPLWEGGRVPVVGAGDVHGPDKTGLPIVYATSALWPIIAADSASSGIPDLLLTVINA
ncbi:MAG: hypothetical protein IPM08_17390 [Actinomycetales bacterium]|nr:hypothetical protein [Comamonadaceae bacterium]MBK8758817.1 hypothetical protein [Actinomycetales bacterium]